MTRIDLPFAAVFLLVSACSAGDAKKPSPFLLCAAEALHAARAEGRSPEDENMLRTKATLFTDKLPAEEVRDSFGEVDMLADRRGASPLIDAAACEALLSDQDRRELAKRPPGFFPENPPPKASRR